tara:strand:- start:3080 stop:4267 length:1188 start_codon:yes stop_codon:yes gene_type:complete
MLLLHGALGYNVFAHPVLFCLCPFFLTGCLSPVHDRRRRLYILAYALGAGALAAGPVRGVLGADAILQQVIACLLLGGITAAPWLMIFRQGRRRFITSLLACILSLLPPVGTNALPNPFMTAGYLFPGTGHAGLILIASLIILPAQLTAKARFGFVVFFVSISFVSNMLYHTPAPPDDWQALNTTFTDFYDDPIGERNARVTTIRENITAELLHGAKVIITPETLLGISTPGLAPQIDLLSARAKRHEATVLIGLVERTPGSLENTLLILGQNPGRYNARQPAPLVMWNLWPTTGFRAHWFRSGVREIAGKRTALLICWEELVPWPMLISSFQDPEIIVSASNHGWAEPGSRIWDYQSLNARALARLYGLPLLRAVNLPPREASPDGNDAHKEFQ